MMRKISFILILFFLLAFVASTAQAQTIEIIPVYKVNTIIDFKSVRDWSNISLLFPDQYHSPEELIEELQQINDTTPEIVDFFTIGESFEGSSR